MMVKNESRMFTLEWIEDNIDKLKLSNESENIEDIVKKIEDVEAGGPIGLTREMLEGIDNR